MAVLPRSNEALVMAGAVLLASSLVSFSRVPLLPDIAREFSLTPAALSAITASFALGRLAVDLPAGRAVDRFPTYVALAAVGVFLSAGSIILGTAPSFVQLLAGVLVVGMAISVGNIAGMVEFSARASPSTRGRSMAAVSMLLLTGQVLGPIFGGTLGDLAGWRAAQVGCAAMGICVAAGCLVWRGNLGGSTGPKREGRRPVGAPLGWRERLILGMSRFVVFFSIGALPQTFVPLIGGDALNLSSSAIGFGLSVGGLSRFVGTSVVGFVADRVSRKAALVPSLAVMGVGAALLALQPSVPIWITSIMLLAAGSAGMSAAAAMLGDRVLPERLGAELSGFRFLGDIGMFVGPILTGVLYGYGGRTPAMLMVSMLLLGCAGVALIFLRDSYSGSSSP